MNFLINLIFMIDIIIPSVTLLLGLIIGFLIGNLRADRRAVAAEARLAAEKEARQRELVENSAAAESERLLWEERFARLKEELSAISQTQVNRGRSDLQDANRREMEQLLKPVREQFDAFRQEVERSRTSGEVAKEELKKSFESTLKLFAMQQKSAMDILHDQAARISSDASSLTRVLRHDTKAQGEWGEMILETLLESSGLTKGEHYFIQENVKDDQGRNFRPDVIVRFPEGRSVIIDSKVSLTAYAAASDTENEVLRRQKLREHARSVRRHIDELATKKYDTLVEDSIGLVLMFIPNDQCYIAAIEQDKDIPGYAYSKGIVIISPSNLMIALQLAYNMWQQDRQNRNVEKIVSTAADLYDKVAGFSETLDDISTHISRLSASYDKARRQLYDGTGNILRRTETLRDLGVTPRKRIRGLD